MVLALLLFPFGYGRYVLDVIDSCKKNEDFIETFLYANFQCIDNAYASHFWGFTDTANWTLLSIALTECIAVAWVYGLAK